MFGVRLPWTVMNLISFFFKDFTYLFQREGEGRRKRGREIFMRERNADQFPLTHPPNQGPGPQPRACAPTGNPTGDISVYRPALNPLSQTSHGMNLISETLTNAKVTQGEIGPENLCSVIFSLWELVWKFWDYFKVKKGMFEWSKKFLLLEGMTSVAWLQFMLRWHRVMPQRPRRFRTKTETLGLSSSKWLPSMGHGAVWNASKRLQGRIILE